MRLYKLFYTILLHFNLFDYSVEQDFQSNSLNCVAIKCPPSTSGKRSFPPAIRISTKNKPKQNIKTMVVIELSNDHHCFSILFHIFDYNFIHIFYIRIYWHLSIIMLIITYIKFNELRLRFLPEVFNSVNVVF